jgi:hypothetical protein
VPDKRARFFAFFTPLPAKTRPRHLAIPPNPPDPAALSRKCGEKTLFLSPQRKPPGTPRLWPHLAELARLAKTALLP